MTKLTGIRSLFEALLHPSGDFSHLIPSLKQQCLLFDSIGILGLDEGKNPFASVLTSKQLSEIEWLKENKIIYNVNYPDNVAPVDEKDEFLKYLSDIGMGDDYWSFFLPVIKKSYNSYGTFSQKSKKLRLGVDKELKTLKDKLLDHKSKDNVAKDDVLQIINLIERFKHEANGLTEDLGKAQIKRESIIARFISIKTMYFEKTDAVSLIPCYEFSKIPTSRKSEVARVAINKLPIPDETTPWEQIMDFRNDANNQSALLNLRRWIRKISSENLSAAEIEEELEWLLNEYERNINLHRIKSNTNAIEVFVKTPLELLENLLTLKFSKLADPLFAIKKRKISLLEAELQAPGREVAYILKTKDHFYDK
jgi:hypothetical protein